MRYILLLFAIVMGWGCEKSAFLPDPDPLENKIKTIQLSYGTSSNYRYDFYYDNLSRIKDIYSILDNDTTTTYRVSYPSAINIKMTVSQDGSTPSTVIWNAIVEQKRILSLQSNQNVPYHRYQFIFKDNVLDTAYEAYYQFYRYGIINFNITYDGSNYLRSMLSYAKFNFVDPANPIYYNNLVKNFTYTNIPNSHLLPLQDAAIDNETWFLINPLYILGLEDYFAFTPNKNLIATKNGLAYEYDFNDKGQVSQMFVPWTSDSIEALNGNRTDYTLSFSYY
jgi:hypothetical protein